MPPTKKDKKDKKGKGKVKGGKQESDESFERQALPEVPRPEDVAPLSTFSYVPTHPIPEWNDDEISNENWMLEEGEVFEDPDGLIDLPDHLDVEVTAWKRPTDFIEQPYNPLALSPEEDEEAKRMEAERKKKKGGGKADKKGKGKSKGKKGEVDEDEGIRYPEIVVDGKQEGAVERKLHRPFGRNWSEAQLDILSESQRRGEEPVPPPPVKLSSLLDAGGALPDGDIAELLEQRTQQLAAEAEAKVKAATAAATAAAKSGDPTAIAAAEVAARAAGLYAPAREGGEMDACMASLLRFVATFAANVAEDAPYLWEAIYPQEDGRPFRNPSGKYAVKLWHAGRWVRVTVDDRLPLAPGDRPLLATSSDPFELWPCILSKALYKLYSLTGRCAVLPDVRGDGSGMGGRAAAGGGGSSGGGVDGDACIEFASFVIHALTAWVPELLPRFPEGSDPAASGDGVAPDPFMRLMSKSIPTVRKPPAAARYHKAGEKPRTRGNRARERELAVEHNSFNRRLPRLLRMRESIHALVCTSRLGTAKNPLLPGQLLPVLERYTSDGEARMLHIPHEPRPLWLPFNMLERNSMRVLVVHTALQLRSCCVLRRHWLPEGEDEEVDAPPAGAKDKKDKKGGKDKEKEKKEKKGKDKKPKGGVAVEGDEGGADPRDALLYLPPRAASRSRVYLYVGRRSEEEEEAYEAAQREAEEEREREKERLRLEAAAEAEAEREAAKEEVARASSSRGGGKKGTMINKDKPGSGGVGAGSAGGSKVVKASLAAVPSTAQPLVDADPSSNAGEDRPLSAGSGSGPSGRPGSGGSGGSGRPGSRGDGSGHGGSAHNAGSGALMSGPGTLWAVDEARSKTRVLVLLNIDQRRAPRRAPHPPDPVAEGTGPPTPVEGEEGGEEDAASGDVSAAAPAAVRDGRDAAVEGEEGAAPAAARRVSAVREPPEVCVERARRRREARQVAPPTGEVVVSLLVEGCDDPGFRRPRRYALRFSSDRSALRCALLELPNHSHLLRVEVETPDEGVGYSLSFHSKAEVVVGPEARLRRDYGALAALGEYRTGGVGLGGAESQLSLRSGVDGQLEGGGAGEEERGDSGGATAAGGGGKESSNVHEGDGEAREDGAGDGGTGGRDEGQCVQELEGVAMATAGGQWQLIFRKMFRVPPADEGSEEPASAGGGARVSFCLTPADALLSPFLRLHTVDNDTGEVSSHPLLSTPRLLLPANNGGYGVLASWGGCSEPLPSSRWSLLVTSDVELSPLVEVGAPAGSSGADSEPPVDRRFSGAYVPNNQFLLFRDVLALTPTAAGSGGNTSEEEAASAVGTALRLSTSEPGIALRLRVMNAATKEVVCEARGRPRAELLALPPLPLGVNGEPTPYLLEAGLDDTRWAPTPALTSDAPFVSTLALAQTGAARPDSVASGAAASPVPSPSPSPTADGAAAAAEGYVDDVTSTGGGEGGSGADTGGVVAAAAGETETAADGLSEKGGDGGPRSSSPNSRKLEWDLQVVSVMEFSLRCDREKAEAEADVAADWEATEPGRADRAARERRLYQLGAMGAIEPSQAGSVEREDAGSVADLRSVTPTSVEGDGALTIAAERERLVSEAVAEYIESLGGGEELEGVADLAADRKAMFSWPARDAVVVPRPESTTFNELLVVPPEVLEEQRANRVMWLADVESAHSATYRAAEEERKQRLIDDERLREELSEWRLSQRAMLGNHWKAREAFRMGHLGQQPSEVVPPGGGRHTPL